MAGVVVVLGVGAGCGGGGGPKPDADSGSFDGPVDSPADAPIEHAVDAPIEHVVDAPGLDTPADAPMEHVVDAPTQDTPAGDVAGDAGNPDGGDGGGVVGSSWETAYPCEVFGWLFTQTVALSPDGQSVALGGHGVKTVAAAGGQVLATYQGLAGVAQTLAFSPDGAMLVAGASATGKPTRNGTVAWRTSDKAIVWSLDSQPAGVRVSFSRDGTLLAIARTSGVTLVGAATGETVATFTGHSSGAGFAAFSPDGTMVASTERLSTVTANNVLLWRVADRSLVRSLSLATGADQPAFSPDGTQLLVSSVGAGGFTRFKVSDGTVIQSNASAKGAVAWAPDGATFFVGGAWRASDGLLLRSADVARDAAFTPDGLRVLMAPGQFWSLADGSKTTALSGGSPLPGNRFVVAADGSITFPTTAASPGAVSPDGRLLAAPPTGAGAPSGQIRITRVADSSLVTILGTTDAPVTLPVTWSPDGTRLVTGGRGWTFGSELLFWNTATWMIAKTISGDTDLSKAVFSPDGRSLLVNGSAEAVVLDVATGARKAAFPISANSSCVAPFDIAYSPDGDLVASATLNGTFVWSPLDGHVVAYLPSPSDRQIAFTRFGIVTMGNSVAYRWCAGPPPSNVGGADGGVTGDGGSDGPSGVDGGAGSCSGQDRSRGDFDGDGVADCVVLRAPDVYFYKGLAGSTFSTTAVYSPRAVPTAFAGISSVIDMTGDGRADLIYFDSRADATDVYVAPGRADGTFRSPEVCRASGGTFYTSGRFAGPIAADFTRDGKTDLFGVSSALGFATPIVFSLGRAGAGSGETGPTLQVGFGQRGSARPGAAGDVDGNGYLDGIVMTRPADSLGQAGPNQFYVAWGNGTGALFSRTVTPQAIASLAGAEDIAPADVNNDGKLDLMVTFGAASPVPYVGDGAGNFTPAP